MSNVSVCFLGEEFIIPSELKDYIEYMSYSVKIRDEVMPLLLNQMKSNTYSGHGEKDFIYFKKPLTQIGKKIIAKLAKDNIFDVTLNDVVYNNSGYKKLYKVCEETMAGLANILVKAINDFETGYVNAYNTATSSITGSGMSVWTNDPIDAAIFSVMEYNTVKGQVNKAEQQYKASLDALERKTQNEQDRETQKLLTNSYYPRVKAALESFSNEIVAFYIAKLEQYNLFDSSLVSCYDMKRSDELLGNLKVVQDKISLLKKAFEYCPYNSAIYLAVLKYGLADVPTFETAKYLKQDHIVIPAVEKTIKNKLKYGDDIENYVMILSALKDKPAESIWKSIYSHDFDKFHGHYYRLQEIVDNQDALAQWVNDNIESDAVKFCDMSEDDLTSKISAILTPQIITERQFQQFQKLDMIDYEPLIVKQYSSLEEVNLKYIEKIVAACKYLSTEQQKIIDRNSPAVEKALERYENAKNAYSIQMQLFQDNLKSLEQEKSKLGIFAFSKKKAINQEILKCESEMALFEENDNTQMLKKEYRALYKKMHSFF
ncbi:MAG: hypothetical protein NC299_07840 [Lachnospiraceae bacterium]|nr:hypothetical protein [Ruminococcus sp.]MCM1275262.1 hypothetical protein [Lachnospiraceae bacterium]